MATSSRFSGSADKGSEANYDFSCSPCGKDGKHLEAVKGCLDCAQNFCAVCLQHHNKFQGMTRHRIVDKAGMQASVLQNVGSLPVETCSIHPGNHIELYCGAHDVVCCAVCIAVDHRSCQGVDYLPKIAVGIKSGREIKDVKDGIKQVKLELDKLQNVRQVDLKRIHQEKNASLVDIDNVRDEIVSHLDSLVKKAKHDVQTKHVTLESKILADINTLQDMVTTLVTDDQHLAACQAESETQVFVHVKEGKNNTTEGKKLLQKIEMSVGKGTVKFSINKTIPEYLIKQKSLGEISNEESTCSKSVSSAVLHGDFNVKVSDDAVTCDITGTCLLADGSMLITDYNNNRLKRLDKLYKVVDHCGMSGWPWGVCSTGPTEVAVALNGPKKIQFMSASGKLKLGKSFKVDGQCRDVAFNNGELFISIKTPSPKVCVYNLSGVHLQTFQNNPAGQPIFSNPNQIVLSNDDSKVYIVDWDNGIITVDRQGHLQSTLTDPQLTHPRGLCMLENDNLLVSGYSSNNIIQVDSEGRKVNVLLSQTDGIQKLQALTYDGDNSRLIVAMVKTDNIKVFNLIMK